MSDVIHYDRTRVSTDDRCRRRRFWSFEFMKRGISPRKRALALEFGSLLHEGLAELILGTDIEAVVIKSLAALNTQLHAEGIEEMVGATDVRVMEIRFLVEGLLRAANRVLIPKLLLEYRAVRVEGEVLYDHDGCRLMSKPDAIMERLVDDALHYFEWKSTSSMDAKWSAQWWKAVQLPAGALGVAQTLGRELAATVVIGLNKGYYSKQYNRQESPLLYGYAAPDGVGGRYLTHTYKNGLRKLAVWDDGRTSKQWVESLPIEVLEKQFISVGPIPFQAHMTADWLDQTAIREKEQRIARDQLFGGAPLREVEVRKILNTVWKQNFDECEGKGWGSPCPYRDACFLEHVKRDPIASGLYEWRQPHHAGDPAFEEAA